jgi:hypothetical protein
LLSFVASAIHMYKPFLLFCLLSVGGTISAQEKTSEPKKTEKTTPLAKEATFVSFESTLAYGKLCLTKTVTGNGSGGSNTVYQIQNKSNTAFNGGKPLEIKLTKDAFDNYFQKTTPELSQSWQQLVRYAEEKKLSFTDEQTWMKVINYYNSFK